MAPPQDFGVTIEPGADRVVADMSGVTFMDSSALSAVVASARALSSSGKRLELGERSPVVERTLQITGLDKGTDDFHVQPAADGDGTGG